MTFFEKCQCKLRIYIDIRFLWTILWHFFINNSFLGQYIPKNNTNTQQPVDGQELSDSMDNTPTGTSTSTKNVPAGMKISINQ